MGLCEGDMRAHAHNTVASSQEAGIFHLEWSGTFCTTGLRTLVASTHTYTLALTETLTQRGTCHTLLPGVGSCRRLHELGDTVVVLIAATVTMVTMVIVTMVTMVIGDDGDCNDGNNGDCNDSGDAAGDDGKSWHTPIALVHEIVRGARYRQVCGVCIVAIGWVSPGS